MEKKFMAVALVFMLCFSLIPIEAKANSDVTIHDKISNILMNEKTEAAQIIRVGQSSKAQYKTIKAALASITTSPTSERERIIIDIEPGVYREQNVLDKSYITLRKAPDTQGIVNITWYYCVGYLYSNVGPDGLYNSVIDWTDERTWNGYKNGDTSFPKYNIGDVIPSKKISYYDINGNSHVDETFNVSVLGLPKGFVWAPLVTTAQSDYIQLEGIYFSNSHTLYVTQEEKDAHITPEKRDAIMPSRTNLSVFTEDTPETPIDLSKFDPNVKYDPSQSAYIVHSKMFNERSHALCLQSKHVTVKECKVRANQDSLYVAGTGSQAYFQNCDLIGGTDYIYGNASAVFENCKLGIEGYSDVSYSAPITAASTPIKQRYGYLFFNCSIYNLRANTTDRGAFGRPWGENAQVTFYNTKFTLPNIISARGWNDMSGPAEKARFYEYGSINPDDALVDTTGRLINTASSRGGSVLDKWHIVEFNPRNYLSGWDPTGFGDKYLKKVDAAVNAINIAVPTEGTIIQLPSASAGVEYYWESNSNNAVIDNTAKTMELIRPAYGSEPISGSIVLYAVDMDNHFGDRKEFQFEIGPNSNLNDTFKIPVTIDASMASDNAINFVLEWYTQTGAFIAKDSIELIAGEKSTIKTIENIPSGTYQFKVTSNDQSYELTFPELIIGAEGQEESVLIKADKLESKSVTTQINYSSVDGNNVYDLIELAKSAGADFAIEDSNQLTISAEMDVTSLNENAYIDIISGVADQEVPKTVLDSRFTLIKLNKGWNQIDMLDGNGGGFSGSGDTDHQKLNVSGKFTAGVTSKLSIAVDYKAKTISVTGEGSKAKKTVSFAGFPKVYDKGDLKMVIYSGNNNSFTVSNVSVIYSKLLEE
jgi:hypothetical protein